MARPLRRPRHRGDPARCLTPPGSSCWQRTCARPTGVEAGRLDTLHFAAARTLEVEPERIRAVLAHLRERGYTFMASVHGVDYYPHEPRLGVIYELLDMQQVDRITVKLRVSTGRPKSIL